MRSLTGPAQTLELGPPLVAPGSRNAEDEVGDELEHARTSLDADPDDRKVAAGGKSLELVPVSWSIPSPSFDRKLPTDEVWDDTGWKSEQ